MTTISVETWPASFGRPAWLPALLRRWRVQQRLDRRRSRRNQLQRHLASAAPLVQRDLGVAPSSSARYDWLLELARRG
jgi:hypothetical protein